MIEIGSEFASYRILDVIGRGGMSTVYLAEQVGPLENRVALKVLSPELSGDESFRSRFRTEARIIARLQHPHIIPVYAAGEEGSYLFLAMRYVDGSDLGRMLRRTGRLTTTQVSSVVNQLAGGLDKAHNQGLVHRDVKPGNVLVEAPGTRDEHIWLTDFGIVKETTAETSVTAAGQFYGTVDYAAPEQIDGRPVDARTDVYALAALTYHCLAGDVPYPRSTEIEKLWAHLREFAPSLAAVRSDVPGAISDVVSRGMSKRPQDRYPGCVEFADALCAATLGDASTAPGRTQELHLPTSPTLPIFRPHRRRRLVPVLVSTFAVLILGVVAFQLFGRPRGNVVASTTPSVSTSPSTPTPTPEQTLGPLDVRPAVKSAHPWAEQIAELLGLYYSAINGGDFSTAYDYETSERKNGRWDLSVDAFKDHYRGSNVSDVALNSVVGEGRIASAQATMKFQRAPNGDEPSECSLTTLNFRMKLGARWRIDAIEDAEPPQPCV